MMLGRSLSEAVGKDMETGRLAAPKSWQIENRKGAIFFFTCLWY